MVQNQSRTEARSWFNLFLEHLGWVAIGVACVSVLLTGVSVAGYLRGSEFYRKGVLIEAVVQGVKANPRVSPTSRVVTFNYNVPEGRFAGSDTAGDWFVARHPAGTTVEIYYLPHDPARVSISARVDRADGILGQVVAGVMGTVALGLTLFAGLRANEAVRARRFGALITAEVTRVEEIVGRHGGRKNLWRLHFLNADGRFGKSLDHQQGFIGRWPVGTQINVYRGPRRSWWIEDV